MISRKIMVAALMIGVGVLTALQPARTEETSRMNVPKGAKVEIQGTTARMTSSGLSGTFNCMCTGQGGCSFKQSSNVLICEKSAGSSCQGVCNLITSTTSAAPGRAQIPAGAMKSDR